MLSGPSLHGTLVAAPVQRGFARTGAHFVRPRGGSCATNAACRLRASRATHPPHTSSAHFKCASAIEDRIPRLIRRHVLEYYGKNPDRKNRSLKSLYKKETDSPSTISKLEKLKPPDFIAKGFELLLADRLHKRNDIRQYFRRYCFLDCGILGKLTGFAMLKQMIKPRI